MIKRFTYFFSLLLMLCMGTSANAQGAWNYQWAHSVDGNTTGGDNIIGMALASDGGYFVATSFGSSDKQTDATGVWLDGTKSGSIIGSPYSTGNSHNNNLVLQKVGQNGSIAWTAYSDLGDIDANNTQIAATSDGGLILAVKTRVILEDEYSTLLRYNKLESIPYVFDDECAELGEYRYLIIKVDGEGNVSWGRFISGLVRTDTKYATKDNATINGLAVDSNDNIYLAGNYRTTLSFPTEAGEYQDIVAKDSLGWDGDSQAVVGDLFLVKLNSQGYYANSLLQNGTIKFASLDKMVCHGDTLYLNGRILGDSERNNTSVTIGGTTLTADAKYQTELLLSANTADLSVNYVKPLTSVANTGSRFVIQNKGAQYLNGNLYYTGLLNGSWQQDGTTIAANPTSKQLKGYVLQVNPATGVVTNAAVRTAGSIGGFFGVYAASDTLYAFGYDMSTGAVLVPISTSDYSVGTATTICSYGTVANATTPIVDGNYFVMANRGGKANNFSNTATFYNGTTTFSNLRCWGTVFYSYYFNK